MNVCAIHADDDDHRDRCSIPLPRGSINANHGEDVGAPHGADHRGDDQRDLAVDADALVVDLDGLLVLALCDARMWNVLEELFHLGNRRQLGAGWAGTSVIALLLTLGARRWHPIGRYRERCERV